MSKQATKILLTILVLSLIVIGIIYMWPVSKKQNDFTETPPTNGIVLQSGGVVSDWQAFVVDFDTLTMRKYESSKKSLAKEKILHQADIEKISLLSRQAIAENFKNMPPVADIDFKLDFSIQGKIQTTETFGPSSNNGSFSALISLLNNLR